VRDLLVGSSAVLFNGNVADESILERFGSKKLGSSRNLREDQAEVVQDLVIDYQIGGSNCEKASLLRRISEH